MSLHVISRKAGPAWADDKGAFEQPGVGDHAAFMDMLANEGWVIFAGPLDGTETGRIHALVIADAADEREVHRRLAADPWARSGHLVVTSIQSWSPIVGADRLVAASAAARSGTQVMSGSPG
jgi:uncharacterized protein YciI